MSVQSALLPEDAETPTDTPPEPIVTGAPPEAAPAPAPHAASPDIASPSAAMMRGATALLSTQPVTWTMTLLSTALVPRFLGSEGLGIYTVAMSIAALIMSVATLGVADFLTRAVAMDPVRGRREAGGALVLVALCGVVAAVGLGAASFILPIPEIQAEVFRIAAFGVTIGALQRVIFGVVIGAERHTQFAWLNALAVVLSTLLGLGVLALGGGLMPYVACTVIVQAFITGLAWRSAALPISQLRLSWPRARALAQGGLPFLAWNVTLQIRAGIDVVLVGALLSAQAAGWLAAAYRVISFPAFIPTVVATPLLPALSRSANNPPEFARALRRSVTLVMLVSLPVSVLLLGLAPLVPGVLHWGTDFNNAIPLVGVLSFQQPLVALDTILGTGLMALHRERRWLGVAVIAAVFNPVMNLVMVPLFQQDFQFGPLAAALIEVCTELVMLGGALRLMPSWALDRAVFTACGRLLVAAVVELVVLLLLRSINLPLAATAGLVAYGGVVLASGVISRTEAQAATTMLRGRLGRLAVAHA